MSPGSRVTVRNRMASRGADGGLGRCGRQTIPMPRRRRSLSRSTSVSSDMIVEAKLDAQDVIEAEKEYLRQQLLEKCASNLAMETMEYKFLSRRKQYMARKLLRKKSAPKSYPTFDILSTKALGIDSNDNLVNTLGAALEREAQPSVVAHDLSLSITNALDFCEPQPQEQLLLLGKPGADRELTFDRNFRSKHDIQMTKCDESDPSVARKRGSRFTASVIRTHTSDSDREEPEEDSGYDAKSGVSGDTTSHLMDPQRAVSGGSVSSSLRPFSSDFESAWGSQELLESDSSVRRKSSKSRSSDDNRPDTDMFQDAEDTLDTIRQYGDFEAGGVERPLEYEVIDLPATTRIEIKPKNSDNKIGSDDKSGDYGDKDLDKPLPLMMKSSGARRPRLEGRRSTSDPVRDRLSAVPIMPLPSVAIRRGSTVMPYHFSMPTQPVIGYMKPTVASLRARYERDDMESGAGLSARDRYRISEEDSYRISKAEEVVKDKTLKEDSNRRYEEWLKKLDEVNVIPKLAKERVQKLEEELSRLKRTANTIAEDMSDTHMARAYRRRLMDEDMDTMATRLDRDTELAFAMSRKAQTQQPKVAATEPQYTIKLISRSTQTNEVLNNTDVCANTDIDFRLMSVMLDKILILKTSVAVQTDWTSDVIERRDACVLTDSMYGQRFSALPHTRSVSAQTHVSAPQTKHESVATDMSITGHRYKTRSLRDPLAIQLSSGVQTDQLSISGKDVACEANFSSFTSEESEDSAVVSARYSKGFHPKTGQLLDKSLLSAKQHKNVGQSQPKTKTKETAVTTVATTVNHQSLYKPFEIPEPVIEECSSSVTTTTSPSDPSSDSEGDYSCDGNVSEIYHEKYSQYMNNTTKPIEKNYYHLRSEEKKIQFDLNGNRKHIKDTKQMLVTKPDLQSYDREPQRPEFRHKFTANKISTPPVPTLPIMSSSKPTSIMKSIETQTNGELTMITKPSAPLQMPTVEEIPKDLITKSKITVEVTKAHKKERSEMTSLTKLDQTSGQMSRTSHVTTSQHIPVPSLPDSSLSTRRLGDRYKTTPSATRSPSPSPHRPMSSPIRKAQSEIDVTPVSGVSTRPASADDLSMPAPPHIPTTISYGSPSTQSLKSSLKTPSPTFPRYDTRNEITVPKVGRVSIQDPMHMVLIAPPDSFNNNKTMAINNKDLFMPLDKSKWRETSSSTICNEMTTDAFKDDDGVIQKPKSISMSTETIIDSVGSESSVKTRSRTARQYGNESQEKAITNETAFTGPRGLLKNNIPYIESEPTSRAYSPPHRTSSSPVVTLIDTPEFLSPEPESSPKLMTTKMSRVDRHRDRVPETTASTPSLVTDVSSRLRPDEDRTKRLVHQNQSRRAAVVEPVQHIQPAVSSDPLVSAPNIVGQPSATEIVTRIIRTSELDESKKYRKNKTVFEQELQSGRDGGCHISSSIAFDNPCPPSRGVIIKEINEDGTSKDGSTDTLDTTRSGEIMTETNFQRFKSPQRGPNGAEETSWKYSMECNGLNGTNTTVRTTIDYKRITYPLTSYETSL